MIETYGRLLKEFPRYSEKGWHEAAAMPYFGDGAANEAGLRSAGNFVFTAALLAREAGKRFGLTETERETLKRRAVQTIRYMTTSHRTGSGTCQVGGQWGLEWQSSWWAARMALGSALLGDDLDTQTARDVARVVTAEVGRHLLRTPPSGLVVDTKAEENAWDCEIIATALALYPTDERATAWREKLSQFAMNSLSIAADRQDPRLVDGRAVRDWNCSVNLHPSFQIENHGAYHFCYVASPLHSLTWSHFALLTTGQPSPEALGHHFHDLWESCLHTFLDNRFAYISGKDWARYTYGTYFMQPVLALLHGRDGDPRAQLIAQRRLDRLELEQRHNDDGSFFGRRVTRGRMWGQSVKYETDCFANLALAYLLHDHYRPDNTAPLAHDTFRRITSGKRISHETLTASGRSPCAFASFSWSTLEETQPLILFAPDGCDDDVEWSAGNLAGRVLPARSPSPPLLIQSMIETANGFRVQGEQLYRDGRRQYLFNRDMRFDADLENARAEIHCRVKMRRNALIRLCEGISLFVPNDLFNGDQRHFYSDTGTFVLDKPTPPASASGGRLSRTISKLRRETGKAERLRRCGERWVNIDNRIGLIMLHAQPGIWISEGPLNSGPDSLFCHRIVSPVTRRWFRAKAGETLIDTHILIMAGTADETREAAQAALTAA